MADASAPGPAIRYADRLPRTADLVVIGGGIVGAATAFYGARAGLRCVLLEARPRLAALTTPASTGAFRAQFDNPEETAASGFERAGARTSVALNVGPLRVASSVIGAWPRAHPASSIWGRFVGSPKKHLVLLD